MRKTPPLAFSWRALVELGDCVEAQVEHRQRQLPAGDDHGRSQRTQRRSYSTRSERMAFAGSIGSPRSTREWLRVEHADDLGCPRRGPGG